MPTTGGPVCPPGGDMVGDSSGLGEFVVPLRVDRWFCLYAKSLSFCIFKIAARDCWCVYMMMEECRKAVEGGYVL